MYISLFIDVEDCGTPLSDDVAKDMAGVLTDHGLTGNMMVVGDKARTLEQRGREDVIAALSRHEIGLHSDRHSFHPTVAEYLAGKRWTDGIEEAVVREGPGVEALRRIFGRSPSCWGQPGGSWAPQIHPAVRRLGLPAIVYPATCTPRSDVHWYGGTLTFGYQHVFGGFDALYCDDEPFQHQLEAFQAHVDECLHLGLPWIGLFLGHPIYVRAREFGDVLNLGHGNETPPELWRHPPLRSPAKYRTALKNLAILAQTVATHPHLEVVPIGALAKTFGHCAERIAVEHLRDYAAAASATQDIPTGDPTLSPAQAVDVLTRAILAQADGAEPEDYSCPHVDGPVVTPLQNTAQARVSWDTFRAGCARVQSTIVRSGHLPAQVDLDGLDVGIGSFYRAACAAYAALGNGHPPQEVMLGPGPQVPAIAEPIARQTEGGYRGWVIHRPDLDPTNLLELTRLQTWTLKPATLP